MTTLIKDFAQHVDETVTLKGWVYNLRSSGKIQFLQVRDGSGYAQAIVSQHDVPEPVWEAAQSLTVESSVEITGTVSKHPKKDEYEIQVQEVIAIHIAEEYPIGAKEHGPDFLLNHRHLWLRSPRQTAIQHIRDSVIHATYDYFRDHGFTKIDAPILTPTSCEDTTELFELDYFPTENKDGGDKAYLTQSGQLYIESAIFSHGKVYDFGPVFRAEKSKTRRHLTEFWMMDAEMAFADWRDNMDVQEGLMKHILKYCIENNAADFEILERDTSGLQKAVDEDFIRMTHAEAVAELQEMGSDMKADEDFGAEDEKILMEKYDIPVFIEKYPAKVKAFYMKPDPEDASRVLCSDLLAPEGRGEIIGGSERIADYDLLVKKLEEFGLDREPFEWYLDLRKYGSVPHSGFGYGLERIVAWVAGIHHIRETIPYPRMMNRLNP